MRTFAALVFASLAASACARTITITAGDDFEASCLMEVQPGDTCYLEKGDYEHDGLTRTHGTEDKRITITGDKDACIKGSNTQDRVLQIAHDYYTIEGICFDGQHGNEYVATAIYVLGADKKTTKNGLTSSVTGLQMFNLEIKNFHSECVHFRYFVTRSEVQGCTIQHCGIEAFESGGGGKVGEGIYVGTALDQVKDGKAPEPKIRSGSADNVDADVCQENWIHHNTFRTYGNECVDVKEGSTNNLIEHNICEQQKDPNSGGFGLRGSENTVRYNEIAECVGAGIRVGGDKGFGEGNHLYGNKIKNTDYGTFNVMSPDQGMVCENEASGSTLAVGAYKSEFVSAAVLGDCDSYPGDLDGFSSPTPAPESSDSGDATPAPEDESNSNSQAGVNFALSRESSVDEIYNVDTNEAGGSSGLGECATVLEVAKVKVEHAEDADETTSVDDLFDSSVKSYFSVNRESTTLTFELKEEAEVNGISIGFFMKLATERRIQTFDIAVRGADDDDWTTVISRKESSGSMEDVQHFPFPSYTVLYVRFQSHGNNFNNWTALTEVEICGEAGQESNALFGGVKAVNKELQMLAGEVCAETVKLSPVTVRANGRDNLSTVFDGNFETRWSTFKTAEENDLDNDKIIIRFLGDQRISKVKIAFFDGHLARPHFGLYTQSAAAWSWTPVLEAHIAEKTEGFQTFSIEASGVNQLYIVGNGNDVGDYTKISEIEIWGC